MRDWRGTTIKVGSTVVYPSRQGSNLWMNEGVVVSLPVKTPKGKFTRIGVSRKGSKRVSYPDPNRITVIPEKTGRIIHGDAL